MHFFHHYSVFFYADYGILYEELLVRAKKNTSRVAYAVYYTYGSTYSRNGPNVPYMQYKMFTFIKLQ